MTNLLSTEVLSTFFVTLGVIFTGWRLHRWWLPATVLQAKRDTGRGGGPTRSLPTPTPTPQPTPQPTPDAVVARGLAPVRDVKPATCGVCGDVLPKPAYRRYDGYWRCRKHKLD